MFDAHCHLTDARFDGDVAETIARAWDAGLDGLVTIASDVADAARAHALALSDPRIWCTAGVHPHVAEQAGGAFGERILELLQRDRVVALGETGLDFHYDNSPRARQRQLFEWHLAAAADSGYPVVVHSRSADDDTAAMIRAYPGVTGVLHCFAGGRGLLDAGLDAGWYVSFAGLITFRNYDGAGLVGAVPAERLLLETDSPYLAPVPHRGRRNEPAFVLAIGRVAAAMRGQDPTALAAQVTANARRFYRIDELHDA